MRCSYSLPRWLLITVVAPIFWSIAGQQPYLRCVLGRHATRGSGGNLMTPIRQQQEAQAQHGNISLMNVVAVASFVCDSKRQLSYAHVVSLALQ